jgi:hypothetical protein
LLSYLHAPNAVRICTATVKRVNLCDGPCPSAQPRAMQYPSSAIVACRARRHS